MSNLPIYFHLFDSDLRFCLPSGSHTNNKGERNIIVESSFQTKMLDMVQIYQVLENYSKLVWVLYSPFLPPSLHSLSFPSFPPCLTPAFLPAPLLSLLPPSLFSIPPSFFHFSSRDFWLKIADSKMLFFFISN